MNRLIRSLLIAGIGVVGWAPLGSRGAAVPALVAPGGVADFGTVADSTTVRLDRQMTLEAWVYPTAWRSYSGREKHGLNFMYKGRIGSHIDYMFTLQANGYLCFGNTGGTIGILRPVVPLSQWTHVAVTINEATGDIHFYVNGVDQGAWGTWGGGVDRFNAILPSNNPLYLGGFNQLGWGYNNDNFIGKVAEMRIWNVARTAEQVRADYQRQLRGDESNLSAYWDFTDRTDKSGHGNTVTLTGAATLQAGQGPDLQGPGGMSVTLTSPTAGQAFNQGAAIPLAATCVYTGAVSSVQFFDGATLLGSDDTEPYEYSWTTAAPGTHALTAKGIAVDTKTGTSAAVTIGVQGPFGGTAPTPPLTRQCEDFDLGGAGVAYADTTAANAGGQYRPTEGVDIAADAAAGNGMTVGWTVPGEWLEYTINVASNGTYTLDTRVAALGAGGQFRLEVNGQDVTGAITVPNTGAWNVYQTVTRTGINLTAGPQVIRLAMLTNGSGGAVGAFDWFRLTASAPLTGQQPYPAGTPWPLPGTVECENFDLGGAGTAYADTTTANAGGAYRTTEGVDIAADAGAGNGMTVGWTVPGEWMEYTVNVASAGTYTLDTRVAALGTGGQFSVAVDGTDVTGTLTIPNTGAWNAYTLVKKTGIGLAVGTHVVRLTMLTNTSGGAAVGAFDWFRFTLETVTQQPYPAGVPWDAPGTVECENFDLGGAGVAYADATTANAGGKYRTAEGVDIAADAGAGNGYTVGWTVPGEWLEYTVNVASAGTYTLETRVAALGSGGQFRIEVNGSDVTGALTIPNTGAWNAYTLVRKTGVRLAVGPQVVRLVMLTNTSGGVAVGAFDWFRIAAEAATPAPTMLTTPAEASVAPPVPVAATAGAFATVSAADVITSDDETGGSDSAALTDGDPATVWEGAPGASLWWIAVDAGAPVRVANADLEFDGAWVQAWILRVSVDGQTWADADPAALAATPVEARYLWFILPAGADSLAPSIREIHVEEATTP